MLLRLVLLFLLCGWSFALAGCHTIDAVHRIARPSPVTAVSVEPRDGRVRWLAEYREPPGSSDPILHGIFVRGVTKRGRLQVDPDSTCVASFAGDGTPAEPLQSRKSLLEFGSHPPAQGLSMGRTLPVCESQLGLRLSGTARYPEAQAIILQDQSAGPAVEVPFPVERPALDPKRWGWLLVAPALDAGTLALSIPLAGAAVLFESLIAALGPLQIQDIGLPVLVLTTTAEDGTSNDRVLGRAEVDGRIYVAANHWPRAWYHRALENPKVQVRLDGEREDYLAVPVTGEELDRVIVAYPMPTVVRFLTGFPPRAFLRLDPR
jgi:hypothetical protein